MQYAQKMTQEEFNDRFREALDELLLAMAESPDVDPQKFYSMTCVLENLSFFAPVLYGAVKKKDK